MSPSPLIAFFTFILTLLCFAAWDSPLTIGKWTLTPVEARTFVWRGVFGACALTSFCMFVELFFRVGINWDALPVILPPDISAARSASNG